MPQGLKPRDFKKGIAFKQTLSYSNYYGLLTSCDVMGLSKL